MAFPTLSVTPGVGATINTLPAAGQDVKANSLPVVIASDQGALSVSGTFWQTTQPVSGTFWQATQPVSAASLPLPTGAAADATLTGGTQRTKVTDGTTNAAVKAASTAAVAADPALVVAVSPNNTVPVSLASVPSHAVTNAGTFAVQAACAGEVAAGSTDSGNPQKIGGVAKTANPTAVTDGQRVNAMFDKLGKQVVVLSPRELRKSQQTALTSTTTETTIVAAGAAGVFNDLYGLIISNSSASAATVTIRDGTGGTIKGVFTVPAGGFIAPIQLTAGDAMSQASAATTWTAQSSASVASLQITALYVQNI